MAVNEAGWGTTAPSSGTHTYDEDTVVDIVAMAAEGYLFTGWTGDVADESSATTTVTMTKDMTVTATFEAIPPEQYTLTMSVSEAGWGTTAPSSGTHTYDEDTVVDHRGDGRRGVSFHGLDG